MTASGWRAGCVLEALKPTSFIRRALQTRREHRRAKTDRLDTELLKRAFLGWLRGEPEHCSMAAIPSLQEEDAKRPTRERENLVGERTRIINRMKHAWFASVSATSSRHCARRPNV